MVSNPYTLQVMQQTGMSEAEVNRTCSRPALTQAEVPKPMALPLLMSTERLCMTFSMVCDTGSCLSRQLSSL